jgi:hypothetical protein
VIDSNASLPGTIFERRATPSDYGGAAEMILDRQAVSREGWGSIGYVLNRIAGEKVAAAPPKAEISSRAVPLVCLGRAFSVSS